MSKSECDSCDYDENANINVENLKLCNKCRWNKNKTNLQTNILEIYPISINTLKKIRSYYYDKDETRYFLIKDIEKFGINKYGSYDAFIKEKNNKSIRKNNLKQKKENDKEYRRKELDIYLKKYNLLGVREDCMEAR